MTNIEIRTIGGEDNQGEGSILGAHETPLVRLFPNAYEDGIGEPRGGGIEQPSTLPNPRDISNIISDQDAETGNPLRASDWIWQWGQFVDHDLGRREQVKMVFPEDKLMSLPVLLMLLTFMAPRLFVLPVCVVISAMHSLVLPLKQQQKKVLN